MITLTSAWSKLVSDKKDEQTSRERGGTYTNRSPGMNADFADSNRFLTSRFSLGNWSFLGAQSDFPKTPVTRSTTGIVTTNIPANSSIPPRRPRLYSKTMKNKGWNSWARSINPLVAGDYYLFTAAQGIEAALLGIAPVGWDGRNIARFTHSIIVDHRGIKAYENGALAETLKSTQTASSLIRIHRHADNTVVYVVTTGTETIVHTSATPLPYYVGTNLYVYGMLYSADDRVTSSALETGSVQYGSV